MKAKDIIIVVVFGLGFLIGLGIIGNIETHYTIEAEVIETNKYETTFEDKRGELWIWENKTTDDFTKGEKVKLYMDNNFTNNKIKDDKIVKIK